MRIQVTPLTSGQVTPGYEQLGRPYRWNGKPPGWPFDPATHDERDGHHHNADAGNAARIRNRKQRLAEFTAHRDQGASVAAAGRLVGISPKTARDYERQRNADRSQCEGCSP